MITLTIDNQKITVPEGTLVLDACIELGIVVPHFCYHKALGAVGACRQCAVHVEDGDNRGVQMSCLVEAKDGMKVDTAEPTAVELRRHVIEWLMLNHPHDCPVCDEGGECQLQDMTIAGGHGIRRYRGKKRTYRNQDLGPFIVQEMNRCIQCYRCVRTYRDYFGGSDFGVMASRNRLFYGRFKPGRLQSPFSGNICDVCPTGVFTDKTFRYRSRYWDLQEADAVCPHCSLGCAIIPGARYRQLQRHRAGVNEEGNGHFICDRGRFGYGYVNHPLRPRRPRAGGGETGWEDALRLARAALARLTDDLGGEAVAWLGSPRASLEANYLLRKWASETGSTRLVFDCHPQRDRAARYWVSARDAKARSLADVRSSDFILLAGSDPLNEAPMLAAAIRQAVRNGARCAVLDARPVELPFKASHLVSTPGKVVEMLRSLEADESENFERHERVYLEGVREGLLDAKKPVIVGGADLLQAEGIEALSGLAGSLPGETGVFVHFSEPNSYGAAMLADAGPSFESVLDDILDGKVKGLICLESDPFREYPDPARVQAALSRLEVLIVFDYVAGEAGRRADIFLPSTAPPESDGTFINCEGRMQQFDRVMEPGEPIEVTGRGDHPPRSFSLKTPGSEPRAAWSILAELTGSVTDLFELRREMVERDSRLHGLDELAPGTNGTLCATGGVTPPDVEDRLDLQGEPKSLQLLPVRDLFGSGVLARYCSALEPVRSDPFVVLAASDAESLELTDGASAILQSSLGRMHVNVKVDSRATPGIVLLPRKESSGAGAFLPGAGTFSCRLLKESR